MLIDRYDGGVHILDRWAAEEEEEAMNGEKRTIAFPSLVCVCTCVRLSVSRMLQLVHVSMVSFSLFF